jgi:hypothetical protein
MGKAPHLFAYRERASSQIFHVPQCVYPHFVCIKYSDVCPYYKMRNAKYDNSCFDIFDISKQDIVNTCNEATRLMKKLRGRVAMYEVISYTFICGFIWFVIVG